MQAWANKAFLLFNIILLGLRFHVACQPNFEFKDYKITNYSRSEGLPHSIVLTIAQDSFGYIWFGTGEGLARFDGYDFESSNYKNIGVNSKVIHCIKFISAEKMFISTSKGSMTYNIRTQKIDFLFPEHESNNGFIDDNKLWIYSKNKVLRLDNKTNTFHDFPIKLERDIYQINKYQNDLYISYSDSAISYNLVTKERKVLYHEKYYNIAGFAFDKNSCVWIFSQAGYLIKYQPQKNTFEKVNLPNTKLSASCILYDPVKHGLFLGTIDGILYYSINQGTFQAITNENSNFNARKINCLFMDRTRNLWIGTLDGGVFKIDLEQKKFLGKKANDQSNILTDNVITSILIDRNNGLWLGTMQNGLSYLNPLNQRISYFNEASIGLDKKEDAVVGCLIEDKNKSIWSLAWNGKLYQINPKNRNLKTFDGGSNDLKGWSFRKMVYSEKENCLWVSSYDFGIELFDIEKQKTIAHYFHNPQDSFSIASNKTTALYHSPIDQNILLVGTIMGLSIFNKTTKKFDNLAFNKHYDNSIPKSEVYGIVQTDSQTIWFTSSNLGLVKVNLKSKKVEIFGATLGLPSNNVFSILSDEKGMLWVSTSFGLSCFNPKNKSVLNYNIEDGLICEEFKWGSDFKGSDGTLYFGGLGGMVYFRPEQITTNPFIPQTSISALRIKEKLIRPFDTINDQVIIKEEINFVKNIELNYKNNDFSIEFSGLHFASPSKIKYKYKLENYDKDWRKTNSTNRRANYANLKSGKYIFHVKSSNSDGIWNELSTEMVITIIPPWWKTLWLKITISLLLLLQLLIYYKFKTFQIKKKNQELASLVAIRTNEISTQKEEILQQAEELEAQSFALQESLNKLHKLNQFKENLTSMIVHDLKNPLNTVISLSSNHKTDMQMRLILSAGNQMLNLVMNILDVQKFEETQIVLNQQSNSLGNIIQEAIAETILFAEQKNQTIVNHIDTNLNVFVDNELIIRVFVNLLTNAIKFTPQNGSIEIFEHLAKPNEIRKQFVEIGNFENLSSMAIICMKDNGSGIPDEKIPFLFERYSQAESQGYGKVRATGLGLAYCRLAIEAHGGKIWVRSKRNEGSVFMFLLPVFGKRNQMNLPTQSSELHQLSFKVKNPLSSEINMHKFSKGNYFSRKLVQTTDIQTHNSEKFPQILALDDDPNSLSIIKAFLTALPFEFVLITSTSSVEIASKLSTFEPDLILLDWEMPEFSGIEFVQFLKDSYPDVHAPIIMATSKSSRSDISTAFEAGVTDYILKPFDALEMISRVQAGIRLSGYMKHGNKNTVQETNIEESSENEIIVIAEDQIEIRLMLKNRLRDHFIVLDADNGQTAYELVLDTLPAMVISDVNMPIMDGLELTKRIKGHLATSHIPVILLTAKGTPSEYKEGFEAGAESYVSKPFNFDVLLSRINSLLNNRKLLREKYSKRILFEPTDTEIEDKEEEFVFNLIRKIEENLSVAEFDAENIAENLNISYSTLRRKIKSITGLTMNNLVKSLRIKKTKNLLCQDGISVKEVAHLSGFTDVSYFIKVFKESEGITPNQFIKNLHNKGNMTTGK